MLNSVMVLYQYHDHFLFLCCKLGVTTLTGLVYLIYVFHSFLLTILDETIKSLLCTFQH